MKLYPVNEKAAVNMKPKMLLKITTDLAMTVSLLLLMTFEMIGEAAHEWIGTAMFVLFILHHILNRHWSRNLIKGKYGEPCALQRQYWWY